jgi:SAM-dependent methyltransferase
MNLPARLLALWDHLGLGAAHVATQMPADLAGFSSAHPARIAGMVFCTPTRLDPAPFASLAERVLMIAGDGGLSAEVTARAERRLPGSERVVLAGYDAPGWADVVADRTDEIAAPMEDFLKRAAADPPRQPSPSGTHAGITYAMQGHGPALVLLPFFLAPSQWAPAIPRLARQFTVITLSGPHVGGVAALEDRGRAPTYRAMVRTLFDLIAPVPGETILDVGCGSGALDRMLATRFGAASPITATDVNPFLLREAEQLAAAEGLAGGITFRRAAAESLPFADDTFGCAFTVTVLEECDADRALSELRRVVRPGGRVGVIVRAIDLPQWWNLDLPPGLREKAETPPQSVAARGVADASLYRRMRCAGFSDLTCFPSLVTLDRPDGPIWHYREDHVLSLLSPAETATWATLTEAARRDGLLLTAHAMHCAVGVKPPSA